MFEIELVGDLPSGLRGRKPAPYDAGDGEPFTLRASWEAGGGPLLKLGPLRVLPRWRVTHIRLYSRGKLVRTRAWEQAIRPGDTVDAEWKLYIEHFVALPGEA